MLSIMLFRMVISGTNNINIFVGGSHMANRMELNDQDLDQVVGGAFHYNSSSDGSMTCRVDGAGTYHCTENAKDKLSVYFLKNKKATLQDAINYALQNGYFWN